MVLLLNTPPDFVLSIFEKGPFNSPTQIVDLSISPSVVPYFPHVLAQLFGTTYLGLLYLLNWTFFFLPL